MPAGETPLLEVRAVSKRFAGVLAVDRATFDVAPRTITALIGPNGAGKSTLFNVADGIRAGRRRRRALRRPSRSTGRAPHVDRAARNGADLPADEGARGDVGARQHAARGARTPASGSALAPLRPVWRGAERACARARPRAARGLRPRGEGGRLRRHALGRPAEAARARPRADARAAHAPARRAARRRQPDARALRCSSTSSACATSAA